MIADNWYTVITAIWPSIATVAVLSGIGIGIYYLVRWWLDRPARRYRKYYRRVRQGTEVKGVK